MEKLCQRCGGAGNLLRPLPEKRLNWNRCTSCGGSGLKGLPRHTRAQDIILPKNPLKKRKWK